MNDKENEAGMNFGATENDWPRGNYTYKCLRCAKHFYTFQHQYVCRVCSYVEPDLLAAHPAANLITSNSTVLAAHPPAVPTVLSDGGPPCSKDPNAPHGFNRDGSHTMGRYVCDCEGYAPIAAHPPAAPVAWYMPDDNGLPFKSTCYEHEAMQWKQKGHKILPLYAHPPAQDTQDAKDAARYRWLRDEANWTVICSNDIARFSARIPVPTSMLANDSGNELDAAIDATIAQDAKDA